MKKFILGLLLAIGITPYAMATIPSYDGWTINSASGTAAHYISGTLCLAASSGTAGTCNASISGISGKVVGSFLDNGGQAIDVCAGMVSANLPAAACDGVTDDAVTIQRMINASTGSPSGAILVFPQGKTIRLNEELKVIPAVITSSGSSIANWIISAYGSYVTSFSTGNIISFGNPTDHVSDSVQYSGIMGGTWFSTSSVKAGIAFYGQYTGGNIVKDVFMNALGHTHSYGDNSTALVFIDTAPAGLGSGSFNNVVDNFITEGFDIGISIGKDWNNSNNAGKAANAQTIHAANISYYSYGIYVGNSGYNTCENCSFLGQGGALSGGGGTDIFISSNTGGHNTFHSKHETAAAVAIFIGTGTNTNDFYSWINNGKYPNGGYIDNNATVSGGQFTQCSAQNYAVLPGNDGAIAPVVICGGQQYLSSLIGLPGQTLLITSAQNQGVHVTGTVGNIARFQDDGTVSADQSTFTIHNGLMTLGGNLATPQGAFWIVGSTYALAQGITGQIGMTTTTISGGEGTMGIELIANGSVVGSKPGDLFINSQRFNAGGASPFFRLLFSANPSSGTALIINSDASVVISSQEINYGSSTIAGAESVGGTLAVAGGLNVVGTSTFNATNFTQTISSFSFVNNISTINYMPSTGANTVCVPGSTITLTCVYNCSIAVSFSGAASSNSGAVNAGIGYLVDGHVGNTQIAGDALGGAILAQAATSIVVNAAFGPIIESLAPGTHNFCLTLWNAASTADGAALGRTTAGNTNRFQAVRLP